MILLYIVSASLSVFPKYSAMGRNSIICLYKGISDDLQMTIYIRRRKAKHRISEATDSQWRSVADLLREVVSRFKP